MTKEARQEFAARVTQANRTELTVITYEIFLEEIKAAREAFENRNDPEYTEALKSAQKYLNELMGSLDYQYEISKNLISLYMFVNKQVVSAMMSRDPEALNPVESVMKTLLTGFIKVRDQDHSEPLMANTQKLYAGLTYGKGHLNETFVNVNEASRGFRA